MKRFFSSLIAASLGACMLSPIPAKAWTSSFEVSYTCYPQLYSNWCWAASAECTAKKEVPGSTRNQAAAVRKIYGTSSNPYPNIYGTISDIEKAAEYITMDQVDYASGKITSVTEFYIGRIVSNHVTVIGKSSSSGVGHAVTITAFYFANDGTRFIRYYDPYVDKSFTCPYSSFLNGEYDGLVAVQDCFVS